MEETEFSAAIRQYCFGPDGYVVIDNMTKFWRLHVYTWCCSQALRQEGSLVECGVHMGLYSLVMAKTLDFNKFDREMYLYDTFEGLSEELSTQHERQVVGGAYDIPDWEKQVRESFTPYPGMKVIRGLIPDILEENAPDLVSFLHLDMNSAVAEAHAIAFFQSRMAPGAIILLDDFGREEYSDMNAVHNDIFGKLGRRILELPTGQGIVMWN
jgi:O-methyltransferase